MPVPVMYIYGYTFGAAAAVTVIDVTPEENVAASINCVVELAKLLKYWARVLTVPLSCQ